MIRRGNAAIEHLVSRIRAHDPGESSHWKQFHAALDFGPEGPRGFSGFGGFEPPYRGWRRVAHRFFQRRYRRFGSAFPEFDKADRAAAEVTRKQGRAYDTDVLRQALTLGLLKRHAPQAVAAGSVACVIGDGFGSMTTVLLATGSARKVVLVNLTRTLLVDLWYVRKWMGAERFGSAVALVDDAAAAADAVGDADVQVIAVEAASHELIRDIDLDVVINIASMQEMDPPVINAYFADLHAVAARRPVVFYCCNRVEKRLPDGTVTRFADYPWRTQDKVTLDELCPWHQDYYMFRPPFHGKYDGPIQHRLVTLTNHTAN